MGIRHEYISTCTLCGAGKICESVVYGDYDGDEGGGSTHSYKNCAECVGLKKASPYMFEMAVRQYERAEGIVEKLTKEFEKDIDLYFIRKCYVEDILRKHAAYPSNDYKPFQAMVQEKLKSYIKYEKCRVVPKKTFPKLEDNWEVLHDIIQEVHRDIIEALTNTDEY